MSYPQVINRLTIAEYNHVPSGCCEGFGCEQDLVCANPDCRKLYTVPVVRDGMDWVRVERFDCTCGSEEFIKSDVFCVRCGSSV